MEEYGFLDIIKEEIFTNSASFVLLIICIILLLFIITWFVAKPISRKMEMKRFAKKHNLQFLGDEKRKFRALDYSRRKNIIKGMYNGQQVEIFDFSSIISEPMYNLSDSGFDPLSRGNITFVNNKPYHNMIMTYLSTKSIEKILNHKIKIKEWGTSEFNKIEKKFWTLFTPLLIILFFSIVSIFFFHEFIIIPILILMLVPFFIHFITYQISEKQKTHNINGIMTRVLLHDPRGYYDELNKRGVLDNFKVTKDK